MLIVKPVIAQMTDTNENLKEKREMEGIAKTECGQ